VSDSESGLVAAVAYVGLVAGGNYALRVLSTEEVVGVDPHSTVAEVGIWVVPFLVVFAYYLWRTQE
jgi:hypothetical protein